MERYPTETSKAVTAEMKQMRELNAWETVDSLSSTALFSVTPVKILLSYLRKENILIGEEATRCHEDAHT